MTQEVALELTLIYEELYELYGPQGWWPLINHEDSDSIDNCAVVNHPLNYDLPKTRNEIYEIMLGTILTQNTTWNMAERALCNLNQLNMINPEELLKLDDYVLKNAIKCAGFLNQKANYIQEITKYYIELDGHKPSRKDIMMVKGVGNETADSILLYAFKQPEFVVDTYTKRIFIYNGMINEGDNYNKIKNLFESNLPRNTAMYNEYHALIVAHAKKYYSKKPYGINDPLKKLTNL